MLKISTGNMSEEIDADLAEVLIILQDQKDIMSMIQAYESRAMSASEEINFLQFILDAGIVWAMPEPYKKRVKDSLEKNIIYFN
tara:strand:+ start:565 stop:816 length:252 start_codon:yes stop_codon:yes gene_type:complete